MRITFIVPFAILAYLVSTDIYTPSMPSIKQYFGEDSDAVQRTLTFFFLGAAISCFLSGYLADIWGKTRISVYGSAIALVGAALCLVAPNLEILIAGRFIMGSGAAVAPVVGLAILQERLSEEQALKVFGVMGILFAAVPGIAPVIGGQIDTAFGWRSNFCLILLMMLASLLLIYFFLEKEEVPKQNGTPKTRNMIRTYATILSNRTFMAYSLIIPLIYAGEWATFSFLPFYAEHALGMNSDIYGLYLGAMILWYGLGSPLGGKLSKKIGVDKTLYIAISLSIVAALILLLCSWFMQHSALMIYLGFSLYLLAFGIMYPASVPKALSVFKSLKGSASSIRGMMVTFVGFLATYSAEVMDDSQFYQLASFIMIVSLFALAGFWLLKPKQSV